MPTDLSTRAGTEYGYLSRFYNVTAFAGMRVTAIGRPATVLPEGDLAHYLRVQFDGENHPQYLHPTWKIDYPGTGATP